MKVSITASRLALSATHCSNDGESPAGQNGEKHWSLGLFALFAGGLIVASLANHQRMKPPVGLNLTAGRTASCCCSRLQKILPQSISQSELGLFQ